MSVLRAPGPSLAHDINVSQIVRTIAQRPIVHGKFFFIGGQKFTARGVTYGPFRPNDIGCAYHDPGTVSRDFAMMVANGVNAVRTYTCPPRWLLDVAAEHDLRVMVGVGLAGEQQTAFLDDRTKVRAVRQRCTADVRSCAGHPAVLAYLIGNEIPSTIVRWHGRRRVERFLESLYDISREHDPEGLVSYVNYPTTEYLQLPFLDFLSYNVYLEEPERFDAYLARLQNIADYKPLVMAEIGLDSLRNGVDAQANALEWQVRSTYAAGCAGAFVFSWTDEWHTGGADVDDWRFGLTGVDREPKPALASVARAFSDALLPDATALPRIAVVVCTYNGSRTLGDCLEGCAQLRYPDCEVIVVNDGSTDHTADIARSFDVRLINTPNGGLSRARNVGLNAATGEIIAYLDDDARPDEHWLYYLARAFATGNYAGIGGPNIVPGDDPPVAQCVANSPGGPTHVLITDRLAEHIPGCNMAFRIDRLRAVGGFDEQFRIAGDDVDVCWKLQARGWTLGFHPAAVVWHHRRTSLKAYWRQQLNYGRAEAMLEVKWPEKYNALGHVGWQGRLYGSGSCRGIGWLQSRIYHGVWATAPFQPLCARDSVLGALPLMPEWYLLVASLSTLGTFGLLWKPLFVCLPMAALAALVTLVQAARSAKGATRPRDARPKERLKRHFVTTLLHVAQPVARLAGRLSYGLTPWRRQTSRAFALPRPRNLKLWSEQWQSAEDRLQAIETLLKSKGVPLRRGGAFDNWDLELRGGFFASVRCRLGIEEYPGGRQYLCFRTLPTLCKPAAAVIALPLGLSALALSEHAWRPATLLGLIAVLLIVRAVGDCAAATSCFLGALKSYGKAFSPEPARTPALTSASTMPTVISVLTSDVPRSRREITAQVDRSDTPVDGQDDGDDLLATSVGIGGNPS